MLILLLQRLLISRIRLLRYVDPIITKAADIKDKTTQVCWSYYYKGCWYQGQDYSGMLILSLQRLLISRIRLLRYVDHIIKNAIDIKDRTTQVCWSYHYKGCWYQVLFWTDFRSRSWIIIKAAPDHGSNSEQNIW